MINNIKFNFTIADLENLSGVKIPTIRMWEKRYTLLSPKRTETNIRLYDINDLRKLLNIVYLTNSGFKISKVAGLSASELNNKVKESYQKKNSEALLVNDFIISSLTFDNDLFHKTYNTLIEKYSFSEMFVKAFIPLLERIGILWQTSTLTPANEHFISYHILRKLYSNIDVAEKLTRKTKKDRLYVLFLPHNEIHELGLLYTYYELLLREMNVVYLGQSVEINEMKCFANPDSRNVFISNFTVAPANRKTEEYIESLHDSLLKNTNNQFLLSCNKVQPSKEYDERAIHLFSRIPDLIENVDSNLIEEKL